MKKVIWAVDAFATDKKLQFSTFKMLVKLTDGNKATIEPVCVLSPDQLKVPMAAFQGQSKAYQLEADTILQGWVKKLKHPRLIAPKLLVQDLHASDATMDVLLKYARESGASLIGLGTYNRKGLERFLLGSFAETLILKSDLPVLLVNPKSIVPPKIARILFPTDFSNPSHLAYRKILAEAKNLKAQVTLYHQVEYMSPDLMPAIPFVADYSGYIEADLEEKRRAVKPWLEEAAQMGVKVTFLLDEKPGAAAEGILRLQKKVKPHLIALASHSGAVASAMMGSVARKIVRLSPVPVWVIHPTKS